MAAPGGGGPDPSDGDAFGEDCPEWRRLLDSATAPVRDLPMSRWKALMRRASGGDSSELPVRVTASVPGSVRLVLRYWNVIDGRFVQDEASQRITAVKPPVLADYTRDGRIDVGDVDAFLSGRPYRFWTNPSAGDRVGGDYYLNPTPLDRNLEWDMRNNLYPNPGSLGERRP